MRWPGSGCLGHATGRQRLVLSLWKRVAGLPVRPLSGLWRWTQNWPRHTPKLRDLRTMWISTGLEQMNPSSVRLLSSPEIQSIWIRRRGPPLHSAVLTRPLPLAAPTNRLKILSVLASWGGRGQIGCPRGSTLGRSRCQEIPRTGSRCLARSLAVKPNLCNAGAASGCLA